MLNYIYVYIFFHHTTCESTCDTLSSSAANQGDNTVSVAQGSTATPGTTKQLLPPTGYLKKYISIYTPGQLNIYMKTGRVLTETSFQVQQNEDGVVPEA